MGTLGHPRRVPNSLSLEATDRLYDTDDDTIQPAAARVAQARDSGSPCQTCYRTGAIQRRIFQPHVCDSQEERRPQTRLQPARIEPARLQSAFQDGEHQTHYTAPADERLPHVDRPYGRVSAHPDSQTLAAFPPFPLGRQEFPISHGTVWPFSSSLAFLSTDEADTPLGTQTGDPNISVFRRLDPDGQQLHAGSTTDGTSHSKTAIARMGSQYEEIATPSDSDSRSPRLQTGDAYDDYPSAWHESPRHPTVNPISPRPSDGHSKNGAQPYDANQGSNDGNISCESLHASASVLQKRVCSFDSRLGQATPATTRLQPRTSMVAQESQQMEWTIDTSDDSRAHPARRCKRPRLGRRLSGSISPRPVDEERARTLNQLERTESHRPLAAGLAPPSTRHSADLHGQHDSESLRQPPRRHAFEDSKQASHVNLGAMYTLRSPYPSCPHPRIAEYPGRPFISEILPEEPMADTSADLRHDPEPIWEERRGFICRPHEQSPATLHLLEAGPSGDCNRRVHEVVDDLLPSICESTVELDFTDTSEDSARTAPESHYSSPTLEDSDLVPDTTADGDAATSDPRPAEPHAYDRAFRHLTMDKRELEARRLEHIRRRFASPDYSADAITTLVQAIEMQTGVASPYRRAQYLFLQWSHQHAVDANTFTTAQLLNFLPDAIPPVTRQARCRSSAQPFCCSTDRPTRYDHRPTSDLSLSTLRGRRHHASKRVSRSTCHQHYGILQPFLRRRRHTSPT